jgi:hypothetical protein
MEKNNSQNSVSEPQLETCSENFDEIDNNAINQSSNYIQQIGYGNEPEPDVNQVIEEEISQDSNEQLSGNKLK